MGCHSDTDKDAAADVVQPLNRESVQVPNANSAPETQSGETTESDTEEERKLNQANPSEKRRALDYKFKKLYVICKLQLNERL